MTKTNKKNDKTFLLGLGHQKCGTTWLHEYLDGYPFFEKGFAKEYHVWDYLDIKALHDQHQKRKRTLTGEKQTRRFNMIDDNSLYFDYFESLYTGSIHLAADITPSYCGISQPAMQVIQRQFEKRNILVKAIILIRDPLSRIKSAVRFNLDRGYSSEGIKQDVTGDIVALEQYYQSEHCRFRTNYNQTIKNAWSVFGKESVYIGTYENMFKNSEIQRLSEFCNTDFRPEFSNTSINQTKGSKIEETELDQKIKAAYQHVYDFCFEHFPVSKALWQE